MTETPTTVHDDEEGCIVTTDMSLVVYLRVLGFDGAITVSPETFKRFTWLVDDDLEGVTEAIDEYDRGKSLVEPKRYEMFYALTRREVRVVQDERRVG